MFITDPFFMPANDWVIVWVGELNSSELDEYLNEAGDAGPNEPISKFCSDLGRWYDHDFIWYEAVDEFTSIQRLCELNGVEPTEFRDAIIERSGRANSRCLLVLWNAKMIADDMRRFAEGRLRCIGNWEQKSPLSDPSY